MAIEIFNRQELKFIISQEQYVELVPIISQNMRLDKYNSLGKAYRLYNLYIDTVDRALIRHSMSKPTIYKEKIRIRSYAPLFPNSYVFLEMKKRYKKITNKRRTKIRLKDALKFIETGSPPLIYDYMNTQVVSEFSTVLQQNRYKPTTYIFYDRMAFHALSEASDLRITFDTNLTSQLYADNRFYSLLDPTKLIMEVKSTTNMPLWLADLLDSYNIYKQSFSKYGTEHTLTLQTHKKGLHA